jgi:hypothetical protein
MKLARSAANSRLRAPKQAPGRRARLLLRAHAGRESCVPLTGLVEASPRPCARRLALKAALSTASRSLQAPR